MAFASSAHSHTPFAPLKRMLEEAKNVSDLSSLLPFALASSPLPRLVWFSGIRSQSSEGAGAMFQIQGCSLHIRQGVPTRVRALPHF